MKRTARLVVGPDGPVQLSGRCFDILVMLLEKPDQLITKAEIFDAIWPKQIVEENTLQVHISALRKELPAGMIMTVHGRGYKYSGPPPVLDSSPSLQAKGIKAGHKPMIAVLPFDNLSGDPDQQFFSDGIAGDITDRLARFGVFAVIGQHSAAALRSSTLDLAAIRERLKVDFVVTGSLRRSGDRIRMSIHLSDATSEEAIWGERYDRPIGDLFTLQDEISELVAAAIARYLEVEINVRSVGRAQDSLSSYEHLLQGYWHYKRLTLDGVAAAQQCFERAIAADPRNAAALAWLGIVYCEGWLLDFQLKSAVKGLEFTAQAVSLDPTNAQCHAAHSWASICVGDLATALRISERGIALNPSDPNVLVHRALTLGYDGRTSEAKDLIIQAHKLEPIPPLWFGEFSGIIAFAEGRYEEALAGVEPIHIPAWDIMYVLACYGHLGDKVKARAKLAELTEAGRKFDWDLGISREPYRDAAIKQRLSDGVAKALAF